MTFKRLYRILASALRRPAVAPASAHHFYLINSQALANRVKPEVSP